MERTLLLQHTLKRRSTAPKQPNPIRTPTIHRLNRAEYINAIRDLLAIEPEAVDMGSLLPADDSGYGFDNIGDGAKLDVKDMFGQTPYSIAAGQIGAFIADFQKTLRSSPQYNGFAPKIGRRPIRCPGAERLGRCASLKR
jgi:hypothetical protein